MSYYRLYHIRRSRFVGVDGIHAPDDVQAKLAAQRLNGTAASELWEGSRKVATFQPDDG